MINMPKRIQLSRKKGFRLPPNTVVVSRPTGFGNPFVVGVDGTTDECVHLHYLLMAGYVCLTAKATPQDQTKHKQYVMEHINELRGKDLACWCAPGKKCHADTLLHIANK